MAFAKRRVRRAGAGTSAAASAGRKVSQNAGRFLTHPDSGRRNVAEATGTGKGSGEGRASTIEAACAPLRNGVWVLGSTTGRATLAAAQHGGSWEPCGRSFQEPVSGRRRLEIDPPRKRGKRPRRAGGKAPQSRPYPRGGSTLASSSRSSSQIASSLWASTDSWNASGRLSSHA